MTFHTALPPWLVGAVEEAGDATVILKAGERPYVIRGDTPHHLGAAPLTSMALEGIAQQILSEDAQETLSGGGSVQETLSGQRIPVTVRADRLDRQLVIRLRHAHNAAEDVPAAAPEYAALPPEPVISNVPVVAAPEVSVATQEVPLAAQEEVRAVAAEVEVEIEAEIEAEIELPTSADDIDTFIATIAPIAHLPADLPLTTADLSVPTADLSVPTADLSVPTADLSVPAAAEAQVVNILAAAASDELSVARPMATRDADQAEERAAATAVEAAEAEEAAAPRAVQRSTPKTNVLEMNRRRALVAETADLHEWIADAMDRGATALYLRAGKRPSARIDGRVETLASDVLPVSMFQRAVTTMSAAEGEWRVAGEWEWIKEIAGTGTVRCQAFSDGQGGGFIVHLPVSVAAGLQNHVPRHIRAACETGEGLIVISAPFAEDVAAMVGAVVAWSAQRRPGFIVAFGAGGGLEGLAGEAFVSERPLPASHDQMAAALHGALRERPDILVVTGNDTLPGAGAIVSAAVGRLVIVGVVARTAPRALEILLMDRGLDRRALAAVFRGACSWRGFRRPGGERTVVSDVLVATGAVGALIEGAELAGLQMAQSDGKDGMRTLDAALAGAVTRRKISLREAAACAVDRKVLVGLVRRQARERRTANRDQRRDTQRPAMLRAMAGA